MLSVLRKYLPFLIIATFALGIFGIFGDVNPAHSAEGNVTLTFGAFSVAGSAYGEIIALFQERYEKETGTRVSFEETYQASGALTRAVAGGLEADVVALQQETEINTLIKAGLITYDWQDNEYKGIVTTSLVVLGVRADNPKDIKDWADVVKPGIESLSPNPVTSGGARWNALGAIGAAKRGFVSGYEKTAEGGLLFYGDLLKNVVTLAKDGRENVLNFENGIGDVVITQESELLSGIAAGAEVEAVYPTSTILLQSPIAVVDGYADKHSVRKEAEAFVKFLYTPEAQRIFAKYYFRPVVEDALTKEEFEALFAPVEDVFTIEEFGGWAEALNIYFGDEGAVTKLIAEKTGN
ncbi:MAG TPA: sulfate ABC transporter substrate-binding protein [Aggregatilineales bacterium]|nr:sulfate ABC transporter substrate-binding protein [Anaerolineales bacterium]HRE48735.1 sulfate ABC transporter substrate-binding protein [Aggregatilineales bacterium]